MSRSAPSAARSGELPGDSCAESAALEALYREHFRSVWRLLRRLGVTQAALDDAAQDVFVVAHRKLPDLAPGGGRRSWLFGIAVRVASEYRRRDARRRAEPLPEALLDAGSSPARSSELREDVRLLHELLAELDEPKRVVFVLSELEELSIVEIAQALGVNVNTTYSRLRSAKQRFEAALARRRGGRGAGR